jgi:hypothetical protein
VLDTITEVSIYTEPYRIVSYRIVSYRIVSYRIASCTSVYVVCRIAL